MFDKERGDKPFNIDDELHKTVVLNKINKLNVLNLNEVDNSIAFMICFALGVNKGVRTKNKKVYGWVRPSSFDRTHLAYLEAVALEELRRNGCENNIVDNSEVYAVASEYVNTGLTIIDEMIPDEKKYDAENITLEFLNIVNEVYNSIEKE